MTKLSESDIAILTKHYDQNKDGLLSPEEVDVLINELKAGKELPADVKSVIEKYDENKDGSIDAQELHDIQDDMVNLTDSNARYLAYSATFSRAFRYLAFTSDFGEALRPVVQARIVTGTYAIAFGYCFADVGWEAYKLKKRGYVTEHNVPMTMSQLIVERSIFQAIASIAVPFAVIHTSVSVAKKAFAKLGRFQKWGPSVVGLSAIPFLPLFLDEPIEHALEWGFARFGPWAHKDKAKHE